MRLRHLVVIVPGIGGSVLATRGEAVAWGRGRRALASAAVRPGRLGLPERQDLVPAGLVPATALAGFTVIQGYDALVAKIAGAFDGVRVQVAGPGADPAVPADVLLFPYDFRLPVPESAARLAAEVESRIGPGPAGSAARQVIVVAHSMGGLVARYWLGPLGGAGRCRALITAGTPHGGAPKALDWLINGVRAGPVTLDTATAVIRGWQSVYDLLPSYRVALPVSGSRVPAAGGPGRDGGRPGPVRADEVPGLLDDPRPAGWFTGPARQGLRMHREIEAAWADLARGGREPEVIPLFGRGHKTMNRAVIQDGRLVVTKDDAEWRPNAGWRGDGTVPASDSIPAELDGRRAGWQATADRHQPMANASRIVEVLANLSGESIAIRGADQPDRPWLGLDLDDLAAAGQPLAVAAQLLGAGGGAPARAWASLGPAGEAAVTARYPMERDGGWWRAEVPPQPPGLYRVTVEATGVPGADRVACSDAVAVVGP